MAPALADVLLGDAEPAGRLPTTIPVRLEHNPSYGNFPGENGHVRYGEGVLVGYRWYEARHLPVRFPFGHGGSYTTFSLGRPRGVGRRRHRRRCGSRCGSRSPTPATAGAPRSSSATWRHRPARVVRPPKELAAFAKVWLDPGETATVELALDERAFAYWDPGLPERDELAARATAVPMAGGRRRAAVARLAGRARPLRAAPRHQLGRHRPLGRRRGECRRRRNDHGVPGNRGRYRAPMTDSDDRAERRGRRAPGRPRRLRPRAGGDRVPVAGAARRRRRVPRAAAADPRARALHARPRRREGLRRRRRRARHHRHVRRRGQPAGLARARRAPRRAACGPRPVLRQLLAAGVRDGAGPVVRIAGAGTTVA